MFILQSIFPSAASTQKLGKSKSSTPYPPPHTHTSTTEEERERGSESERVGAGDRGDVVTINTHC